MIRVLLFMFLFLLSFPAFSCENKNHIFLIHGIGGSVATFGSMEIYLNKLDQCYVTTSFAYDTGNSTLSTYDFAERFHRHVKAKINAGSITVNDKISLIMHSQGGIIGNIWLNFIKATDKVLFSQVDSFITLSTPHWGADMANLGKSVFFTLPPGMGNRLSPFGRIELNEMSYGSGTIRDLVWSYEDVFKDSNLRPLALAGHKKGLNLKKESDVVVPIYSSRADHYKASALVSLKHSQDFIPSTVFTKSETTPLVLVPATHIKMDIPGIADIPKKCLIETNCDHPSIAIITSHLKGRSVASSQTLLKQFRVNLYVNNNSGESFKDKDISLRFVHSPEVNLSPLQGSFRGKAQLNEGKAFTIEGESLKAGVQKITVELKIRNTISRLIEIPAEGGHTSLLNVNLID